MGLGLACGASPAAAGNHPLVQLEIDPCVDAPRDEIRRLVSIELGALLSDDAATAGRTRATVSCSAGAVLALRVDDPITGNSLTRTVDIGAAIPQARARLVALAIVELISASWTELEANPVPRAPPSGPRPSSEARDAALLTVHAQTDRSTQRQLRLEALGGGLKYFSPGAPALLAGGGLRLAGDLSDRTGWMLDAQVHHGTTSVSLGQVSTDVLGFGAVGYVHKAWSAWRVELGGGVRGGAVLMTGVPDAMVTASRFWAPWVGPVALADLELAVRDQLVLVLDVEGGYVVSPVGGLVDGLREVAIDGAWIGVHLGIGIVL
jgi:hypothetical protein